MTVRAYARVSTPQQELEGFSLAAQRERAKGWAQYQGLTDIRHYEDGGISGKRDDRPALLMLLDDIEPGDTVLVYSLSRLGRGGVLQLLGTIKEIEDKGGRLVSLTESIDTKTPTGRLLLTILAALAEMEVEQTRERSAIGKVQAARQGVWPGPDHTLPFGYMRDEGGRIVAKPEEAEVVREVIRLSGEGISCRRIAAQMQAAGIPVRRSKKWSMTMVHAIRLRPYYQPFQVLKDRVGGHEIEIPCPPLVTEAEWNAAQQTRSGQQHHRKPADFPLTGHLRCTCGGRMMGTRSGYKRKSDGGQALGYACSPASRPTSISVCPVYGVRFRKVSNKVEGKAKAALAELLRTPEALAALTAKEPLELAPDHSEELAALARKRDALLDLYLEGVLSRDEFDMRREKIERQVKSLEAKVTPVLPPNIQAAHAYADAVLQAEGEQLNELLRLLKVEFILRKSGAVDVLSIVIPN